MINFAYPDSPISAIAKLYLYSIIANEINTGLLQIAAINTYKKWLFNKSDVEDVFC
ncbi:hypothetical protein HNR48_003946 [Pseudoteredinibacter isoporae]|uniref:Uncharacterized protein n=1 Tax=Pseudoteredinibacter isoporae TaxID=570281 RepID=A0A7X0JWN6_9GAMM|nr:hypothetical protein [Pseudoteredinibacter isoporae]